MGWDELDSLLDETLEKSAKSCQDADLPCLMVVDDNVSVCDALEAVLADRFRVISFNDAQSALAALDESVHVVLLDIKMEGIDGFQCFEMMRTRFTHLPIVFHSAYQDLRDPYEVMNTLKPFGYLHKGAPESEMVALLERAVEYRKKFIESERKLRQLQAQNEELQRRIREREEHIRQQKESLGHALGHGTTILPRRTSQPPSAISSAQTHSVRSKGERLYGIGSVILRLGVELETCRKEKKPLLFYVAEVDSFEAVRRRAGVSKSEDIVERIATSLAGAFGGKVLVGRLGDAKVALIAPGIGPADLTTVSHDLKARIAATLHTDGATDGARGSHSKLSVSSGSVCVAAGAGIDARRLMAMVERALEVAKRRGPGSSQSEIFGTEGRDGVK